VSPSRPLVTDAETSLRLSRVRQRDTSVERLVRSMLHRLGLRFRVGGRGLPGRPDVANVSRGWAVLVHGCYWHSHRGCRRATVPKRNRGFWEAKFEANRARDRRVLRDLRAMGIRPVVVWECDVEERPEAVARRLREALAYE
jgi:DNA mismatch endonuclease, patch repair protein